MPLLVRPYPVDALASARDALAAAQTGSFELLKALFAQARDQLHDVDPDEISDPNRAHPDANTRDKAALNAALDVADAWEGVVAIGGSIQPTPRFRGFIFACACLRYLDVEDPDLSTFKAWCRGEWLPDLGPEDSVLYAALPALLGLGPELADELPSPAPVEGQAIRVLLDLPDEDWSGADPLDGVAVSAEACAAAAEGATGEWKTALLRGARRGLVIREG